MESYYLAWSHILTCFSQLLDQHLLWDRQVGTEVGVSLGVTWPLTLTIMWWGLWLTGVMIMCLFVQQSDEHLCVLRIEGYQGSSINEKVNLLGVSLNKCQWLVSNGAPFRALDINKSVLKFSEAHGSLEWKYYGLSGDKGCCLFSTPLYSPHFLAHRGSVSAWARGWGRRGQDRRQCF